MNSTDIANSLADTARAATHLSGQLGRLNESGAIPFPLSAEMLSKWGDAEQQRLYAYLYLFEQLQELVTRRMLRGILALEAEDVIAMSARDVANMSEKLGVIESADVWKSLLDIRNLLAHDYPMDLEAQAARANKAWTAVPDLQGQTRSTIAYIEREGLLDPS